MGKATGFLEIERKDRTYEAPEARVQNFREFVIPLGEDTLRDQAARCMDCGVPYCHNGCPVNNQIPDWNDLVYEDDWQSALANLHSTNNFPEFTGRICPAPCEAACTLNIDDSPVTIKSIECAIIDKGWENGWIAAQPPAEKTGKSVAIVGAGPAGMAAAQQLARQGHDVHIYEKHAKAGGLLRYGIPDFKMEKHLIDRRVEQLETEGVTFHYNTNVGVDMAAAVDDGGRACGGGNVAAGAGATGIFAVVTPTSTVVLTLGACTGRAVLTVAGLADATDVVQRVLVVSAKDEPKMEEVMESSSEASPVIDALE